MIVVMAACAACDGLPAPVGVQGVVTLDAQPIPEGRIEFEPLPGSSAQHRDADIRNGKFILPEVEGLIPGQEFRVIIKAFRKTGRQYAAPDGISPFAVYEQYLPEKCNSASNLRVTIHPDQNHDNLHYDLVSSGG